MEWEGNLKLTDSEQYDGAVELRTVDEDQLVMTLRLVRTTSSLKGLDPPWHRGIPPDAGEACPGCGDP